ncbi:4Fe-4S binding protein [Desulfosporosinus sp. PR]|uniref:ATP-binding protein n=1 Tax=Candidatus Desulfosporosinus nitrosoreducens TaxID=3401928 RepID=UPI0027E5DE81|nr:4Fe-4S binding protein [Desulfosporosinus sp. PR]MDQ7092384.1 4Fe-4S binding protein [Desulfosporosinus sp. PR]
MLRKIIRIDEKLCNGCGLCISACHEEALQLINGKAKLISESYCDGLGNCLPECPTGAITLEERESCAFNEEAVKMNLSRKKENSQSQLAQWPCQLKLVSIDAPYFDNAHLLLAADCTAFAYPNIHQEFMQNKITLIACPKLDAIDYSEKLTAILKKHSIKQVTILKMEVPCCGGLVKAAKSALADCGKLIDYNVVTISINGTIV